ncbi:MAG: pilus assembly protein [Alphaproteobacteria bacterium]
MLALRRIRPAGHAALLRQANNRPRPRAGAFLRDEGGAALVEFAFAGPILLTTLIGIVEVSMVIFLNLMVESGVREAARFGLTGAEQEGMTREEYIVQVINDRTMGLLDITDENVEMLVYDSFEDIVEAEPYVDVNLNEQYDDGEPYTDTNGNGAYDADPGVAGAGESGEIVLYRVTANWAIFTTYLADLLGDNGLFTVSASVVVRNEPWDIGT